jgi:hypothetical protein
MSLNDIINTLIEKYGKDRICEDTEKEEIFRTDGSFSHMTDGIFTLDGFLAYTKDAIGNEINDDDGEHIEYYKPPFENDIEAAIVDKDGYVILKVFAGEDTRQVTMLVTCKNCPHNVEYRQSEGQFYKRESDNQSGFSVCMMLQRHIDPSILKDGVLPDCPLDRYIEQEGDAVNEDFVLTREHTERD